MPIETNTDVQVAEFAKIQSLIISFLYQTHAVPPPELNVSIQDDNQRVRYSETTSPILTCSAQLSPYIDIPISINFWWLGPNGKISNITEESGATLVSEHAEWNSSIVISSASTNDSGEYMCLVTIYPRYISTFIIPSQMVSETVDLTIGELLKL